MWGANDGDIFCSFGILDADCSTISPVAKQVCASRMCVCVKCRCPYIYFFFRGKSQELYAAVAPRNVTEFSYRYHQDDEADIIISFQALPGGSRCGLSIMHPPLTVALLKEIVL